MRKNMHNNNYKVINIDIQSTFDLEQCLCDCIICQAGCPNYGKIEPKPGTGVIKLTVEAEDGTIATMRANLSKIVWENGETKPNYILQGAVAQ